MNVAAQDAMGDVASNGGGCWILVLLQLHRACSGASSLLSMQQAQVTVDIQTSNCTPLVQLSLDLSVPNHFEHVTVRPLLAR